MDGAALAHRCRNASCKTTTGDIMTIIMEQRLQMKCNSRLLKQQQQQQQFQQRHALTCDTTA